MDFENIEFDLREGVAYLTLNRPTAANALSLDLVRELLTAAETCSVDSAVRAVLLTGAGRMFCGGGDLRGFDSAGDELPSQFRELVDVLHAALAKFARMDAPLIVAVNGVAAGAGMSVVVMSDYALAADSASFTMAYTAAGLTPDGGSSYFLPRTIGMRRAKELMLTNRRLSAAEALEWGIVQRVVADDALLEEAETLARSFAEGPLRAFGATKRLLLRSGQNDLETQMDAEMNSIVEMSGSADGREGISAFLEKRKPSFKGE